MKKVMLCSLAQSLATNYENVILLGLILLLELPSTACCQCRIPGEIGYVRLGLTTSSACVTGICIYITLILNVLSVIRTSCSKEIYC